MLKTIFIIVAVLAAASFSLVVWYVSHEMKSYE